MKREHIIYYAAKMLQDYCGSTNCEDCLFCVHDIYDGHNIDICCIGSAAFPTGWELEDLENEIKDL